ncbi:MAG: capsular polysaccharide synthesis protein [Oscillospiraceae bacterium]|nr:capsular polysaccharide synthesis protein [Oscillospiraceae bacterium]
MNWTEFKSMLERSFKKGDTFPKMICLLLMKLGYSNQNLQILEVRNKMHKKIERKYYKTLQTLSYPDIVSREGLDNIWLCWLQGIETAPDIVKACIASIQHYHPEKQIHIITADNFQQYATLPDFIIKKWKKGIIGNAHFTDLLRMQLLIEHGGTWLDATVYLTGPIPSFFYERKRFMYHSGHNYDSKKICNNWFIIAGRDDRILKCIRDMLYTYWKQENRCREYFIWHLFAYMVYKKYPEEWADMYDIPETLCDYLMRHMPEPFHETYWTYLTQQTSIHKLSTKLPTGERGRKSYYDYIIEIIE